MQRPIKFRAWILGKMWEVRALDWNEDGTFITTDGGFMHLCEEDDVALMQYTGLHGKQGKEIYEGDIVRHRYGIDHMENPWVISSSEHINEIGVIEWGYRGWRIEPSKEAIAAWTDIEVIGNIYENPELCEVIHEERNGRVK